MDLVFGASICCLCCPKNTKISEANSDEPAKNVFKDHCVMRTKDENLNDLPLKASALTASYYGLR
jgi:hypothetical protein